MRRHPVVLFLCAHFSTLLAGASPCAAAPGGPLIRLSFPGGDLRAYIAPLHGADLAGLQVRRGGSWSELLYRGMNYRPTGGWTGKASILWPAVGRNFPNAAGAGRAAGELGWVLQGRVYPIPLHGFARDQAWRIVGRGSCDGSSFLTLALRDNARTRGMYPFGFTLTTEYRIWRQALYIRQTVRASRANAMPMPFSIGNHITFRIPLLPGDDLRRTAISTPAAEQVITDASGRPTGRVVKAVGFAHARVLSSLKPLTPISLSGYAAGQEWVRLEEGSGFAVVVSHTEERQPKDTPVLFNLWGDAARGYFAPEPWVGKQDSLATGDGTISLPPGDAFHWMIEVRVAAEAAAGAMPRAAASAPTCLQ